MSKLMSFCQSVTIVSCLVMSAFVQAQSGPDQGNPNQAVTDLIRLQHRTPDSIRSAIEPQLDPRGAINQFDNALIISTSRANLTTLRQMIEELDIPLRQVRINVDFAYGQPLPAAVASVAAEAAQAAETADTSPSSLSPSSLAPSSLAPSSLAPSPRQSIVVTEGDAVWFENRLPPVVLPSFADYPPEQTGSPEVAMGFGASVELRDNRVILRTAMPQDNTAGGGNNLQDRLLSSTIELEPGQWFVLNAPPEDDAIISEADSGDFNDFAGASGVDSNADTRSAPAASDSAPDLMAVQVEPL